MAGLSDRKYIRWDAEGVEVIPPNEREYIDGVVKNINESQRRFHKENNRCYTGTHARTRGIVQGTLVVSDDLPAHLKQTELFSQGGTFPIVCRYRSEPGNPQLDDTVPQPRGFSMKIFNVRGDMFDAGKDFPTQDIEFNSTPAIELADAKTAKEIFDIRLRHSYDSAKMAPELEARPDTELQKARDQVPNHHLESTEFYSQAAFRFGDYVVKYRIVPASAEQQRRGEEVVVEGHTDGVLSEWLRDFYRRHEGGYLFQVQFLENLEAQPVEYSGTEWEAGKYPFQTVARLQLPRQESWDEERNQFWAHRMRLDPWHGLTKLRPLGSSNRLRRILYPASSKFRREANGLTEVNVTSPSEIPGF